MNVWRALRICAYLLFVAALSWLCFRHPVPDDFDRYMYEAIVRCRHQPAEIVYELIKHENPRAESSSILDSPDHMVKLEPLYAIRPVYIWFIAVISDAGLPVQAAINLLSAISLFGLGVLTLVWTSRALPSALLIAAAPILVLGRLGTPDALSALVVLTGLWILSRSQLYGLVILVLSVWVRTDNVVVVAVVLLWLAASHKISWQLLLVFSLAAVGSVLFINHLGRNYGWAVLFRWSFLGGNRSPADIIAHLSIREYVSVLLHGLEHIFSYVSVWLLIGMAAWRRSPSCRQLLGVVGVATTAHFLLFPSAEGRYFSWAYLVAGITLIKSFTEQISPRLVSP